MLRRIVESGVRLTYQARIRLAAAAASHRLQSQGLKRTLGYRSASTMAEPKKVPQVGIAVLILRQRPTNQSHTHNDLIAYPYSRHESQSHLSNTRASSLPLLDVLLVKRAKAPLAHWYGMPGGKLELGETLEEGAQREVWEETRLNITVEPEPITVTQFISPMKRIEDANGAVTLAGSNGHYILIFMKSHSVPLDSETNQPQVAVAGDDAAEVRWFPIETIATHLKEQQARLKEEKQKDSTAMVTSTNTMPLIIPDVLTVLKRDRTLSAYFEKV